MAMACSSLLPLRGQHSIRTSFPFNAVNIKRCLTVHLKAVDCTEVTIK